MHARPGTEKPGAGSFSDSLRTGRTTLPNDSWTLPGVRTPSFAESDPGGTSRALLDGRGRHGSAGCHNDSRTLRCRGGGLHGSARCQQTGQQLIDGVSCLCRQAQGHRAQRHSPFNALYPRTGSVPNEGSDAIPRAYRRGPEPIDQRTPIILLEYSRSRSTRNRNAADLAGGPQSQCRAAMQPTA